VKSVSGKQLCRVLEKHGWELKRTHGSHHIYVKSGHEEILTVPVHGNRDLQVGLLNRLLKLAELTENDL